MVKALPSVILRMRAIKIENFKQSSEPRQKKDVNMKMVPFPICFGHRIISPSSVLFSNETSQVAFIACCECLINNVISIIIQSFRTRRYFDLKFRIATNFDLTPITLADPRGCQGRPPPGPNFFDFHAVFGENCQNNRLALPPLQLAHPPLGNPGSATALRLSFTNTLK